MSIKKASAWRNVKRPYTRRSKSRAKSFIKTVPPLKIQKFVMGDSQRFNNDSFEYVLKVVSQGTLQVRDNALEASRRLINREFEKIMGKGNFYFAINVYPHHVLRENKMLTGAGADRLQTGMQLSFGKVVGNAIQVKKGTTFFTIAFNGKQNLNVAMSSIKKIKPKLPCHVSVIIKKSPK